MAQLTVLLYSTQQSQRIKYTDSDGVMTAEIHSTYLKKCEVLDCRPNGARIMVCAKTRQALLALEQKYEQATKSHIRKLLGFLSKLKDGDYFYYFKLKEPIVNEQMYKALCKMVIDMLPSSELPHFKNTVRWIVSDNWMPDSLPSIWLGLLPTDEPVYKQPALDIFLHNKGVPQESPYCTAVIWIYDVVYLFVVPFVDKDAGRYKKDEQLLSHIREMMNWTGLSYWYQQDTMDYHQSTSWIDWKVDPLQSYVHILPQTDPVFEACRKKEIIPVKGENMPDVKPEYLSLGNIEYVRFQDECKEPLDDDDLQDVTTVLDPVIFRVNAEQESMDIKWHVDAYDSTATKLFFSYEFSMSFYVNHFKDFVKVEIAPDGNLSFFAFHYQLRDMLFELALAAVTPRMQEQQKNTIFEGRLLTAKPSNSERILARSVYHIPIGNQCLVINDFQIHGVEYE